MTQSQVTSPATTPRLALVTGGGGRLAAAVRPALEQLGWQVAAPSHSALDITQPAELREAVHGLRPHAVVNLAAWTDADGCELDPERARRVNTHAVGHLAELCAQRGAHLCHVSSDYVFSGATQRPYTEADTPAPLSVYGSTKAAADELLGDDALVVRVGWLSGPTGRSVVGEVLRRAAEPRAGLDFVLDQVGSPSVTTEVAQRLARLVDERHHGLVHVASDGSASAYDLARHVMVCSGDDPDRIVAVSTDELRPRRLAPRPAFSALGTDRLRSLGLGIGAWQESVARLVDELVSRPASVPA